jgi:hypothetical protein
MKKLMLVFFSILFVNISFGQKTENEIFEATKGKWEVPIKKYTSVFNNEEMKNYAAYQFDSTLRIITDSAYEVKALQYGEVILINEVDSSKYCVLLKCGNYFTSYYPLKKPSLKYRDVITKGATVGVLAKGFENKFILEIGLQFKEKELSARNWINWNSIIIKNKENKIF